VEVIRSVAACDRDRRGARRRASAGAIEQTVVVTTGMVEMFDSDDASPW
jgi:hypothetical protein